MAIGDPPTQDFQDQLPLWSDQQQRSTSDENVDEQWFFQFHEHLLLTVQAIYRLRQALAEKMP
jgi:hypothetical protein